MVKEKHTIQESQLGPSGSLTNKHKDSPDLARGKSPQKNMGTIQEKKPHN